MIFRLTGPFKPYTRMTRRGKFIDRKAQDYLASQEYLKIQMAQQMARHGLTMYEEQPLSVAIEITMTKRLHCQDLDNQTKAILDAAQGIAFDNDRWIDRKRELRHLGDCDEIFLWIEPIIDEKHPTSPAGTDIPGHFFPPS